MLANLQFSVSFGLKIFLINFLKANLVSFLPKESRNNFYTDVKF